MKSLLLSALTLALVLAGCATPGPYAQVTGERSSRADPYESSVLIMGVDGHLDVPGSESAVLEPGHRMVPVRTTRRGEDRDGPDALFN